jgi:hypothetical protein
MHYHIRWSDSKVDWQAFASPTEANASAEKLARPGEGYAVEKFEGMCWRCAQFMEAYRQMRTQSENKIQAVHKVPGVGRSGTAISDRNMGTCKAPCRPVS